MEKDKKLTIISIIIIFLIIIIFFLIFFSYYLVKENKNKDNQNLLKEYAINNKITKYNSSKVFNDKLIKCNKIDNQNLYNCSINNKDEYCYLNGEFKECQKNESLIDLLKKSSNDNYFKGNNVNNYLWYKGFLWRIIEFDEKNKKIKLITENPITNLKPCEKIWYNEEEYNNTYINKWLNEYFFNVLNDDFKNHLLDNNYNIGNYKNIKSITTNKKIGLLDEEEYLRAGGNKSFLNINDNFLLGNTYNEKYFRLVSDTGNIEQGLANIIGIRPVIVIDDLVNVSGTGTKNDFYKIDNYDVNIGEYININGKSCPNNLCTFRIVNHKNNTYKLILNDLIGVGNYYDALNVVNNLNIDYAIKKELPIISELFTSNDINLNKNTISNWYWISQNNNVFYAINSNGLINRVDKSFKIGIRPIIYIKDNIKLNGLGTINNPYKIEGVI